MLQVDWQEAAERVTSSVHWLEEIEIEALQGVLNGISIMEPMMDFILRDMGIPASAFRPPSWHIGLTTAPTPPEPGFFHSDLGVPHS